MILAFIYCEESRHKYTARVRYAENEKNIFQNLKFTFHGFSKCGAVSDFGYENARYHDLNNGDAHLKNDHVNLLHLDEIISQIRKQTRYAEKNESSYADIVYPY